ncbi:unnamed protein product [Brachionus calyciflorus]|uniref:Fibrinogen C-terminal domain-containing protein n=1 Tax=Brachionus calyciflorus TaxID=104777 RepID=A0A814A3H7_9BILA|nr:unnamed protein product [Brachionus calyciflorus]
MKCTALIMILICLIFGTLCHDLDPDEAENKITEFGSDLEELSDSEIIGLIEASNNHHQNEPKLKLDQNKTVKNTTSTITNATNLQLINTNNLTKENQTEITKKLEFKLLATTKPSFNSFLNDKLHKKVLKEKYENYDSRSDYSSEEDYEENVDYREYSFNQSVIVVWKKMTNRNYRVSIFGSRLTNDEVLTVWYYSTINSLVFEITRPKRTPLFKILRLEILNFHYLFFNFDTYGKLGIYLDCPSLSNQRINYDLYAFELIEDLRVFKWAKVYSNLELAMKSSECRIITSVQPSVVVYFNTSLSLTSTQIIFSFTKENVIYSLIYFNGIFKLISSTTGLNQAISKNEITAPYGVYFVFRFNSVYVYTTCPSGREPILHWVNNYFNKRTQIESSLNFQIGSALTFNLLDNFCFTEYLNKMVLRREKISYEMLSHYLENAKQISSLTQVYLPLGYQLEKLKYFKFNPEFSLNYLYRPESKILIASRVFAKRGFFDRSIREYIMGFSDGGNNFWIGLDLLNKVTQKVYSEEYGVFRVGSEENKFRLTIRNFRQGVNSFFENHNHLEFSTFDFGSRRYQALKYSSGFWHRSPINNSSIDNFYCFSCEDEFDSYGSSYIQTVSYISIKSYVTKMYLIL